MFLTARLKITDVEKAVDCDFVMVENVDNNPVQTVRPV